MQEKVVESVYAIYLNCWYLEMRARNQNFDKKFEISEKFRVEWYMIILTLFCEYKYFEENKKLRGRGSYNLCSSFSRISLFSYFTPTQFYIHLERLI